MDSTDRLTCDVYLEVLDIKYLFEVLEKFDEILSNLYFVGSSGRADGVACANWLINPAKRS